MRQPTRKCCFTKSSRAEISTPGIFVHGADEIGICRICGCSALRYGAAALRISGFFNIAGNLNHIFPRSSLLCSLFLFFFYITYRDAHVANRINLLWNICHHCRSKFYNGAYTNLCIHNALFFSSIWTFYNLFSIFRTRIKVI